KFGQRLGASEPLTLGEVVDLPEFVLVLPGRSRSRSVHSPRWFRGPDSVAITLYPAPEVDVILRRYFSSWTLLPPSLVDGGFTGLGSAETYILRKKGAPFEVTDEAL